MTPKDALGGTHEVTVDVNNLRRLDKPAAFKPKKLHPLEIVDGLPCQNIEIDAIAKNIAMTSAIHMLRWLMFNAYPATVVNTVAKPGVIEVGKPGIHVSNVGTPGKLPIILQARAQRDFKSGQLVLVPYSSDVVEKTNDTVFHTARSQDAFHPAMIPHVELTVRYGCGDRRKASTNSAWKHIPFLICSPLLAGKAIDNRDKVTHDLPPFWAVLSAASTTSYSNMALKTLVLPDAGYDDGHATTGQGVPKKNKSTSFSVEVPVLHNVKAIHKGELLSRALVHPP